MHYYRIQCVVLSRGLLCLQEIYLCIAVAGDGYLLTLPPTPCLQKPPSPSALILANAMVIFMLHCLLVFAGIVSV